MTSNTDSAAGTDAPARDSSTAKDHASDLTGFQRDILVVLADDPQYGLGIKGRLEEFYQEEVNHGRLYPNLDDLVDDGYLTKSELDKRTNEYALTEWGRGAVNGRLQLLLDELDKPFRGVDESDDAIQNQGDA